MMAEKRQNSPDACSLKFGLRLIPEELFLKYWRNSLLDLHIKAMHLLAITFKRLRTTELLQNYRSKNALLLTKIIRNLNLRNEINVQLENARNFGQSTCLNFPTQKLVWWSEEIGYKQTIVQNLNSHFRRWCLFTSHIFYFYFFSLKRQLQKNVYLNKKNWFRFQWIPQFSLGPCKENY